MIELGALQEIEAAFADGRLRVEVDERSTPFYQRSAPFVDDGAVPQGTPITWVHVMSRPAGGEIRGYALVLGQLRERGPHYLDWPEMDAAVAQRLGVPLYARAARSAS